MTLAILIFGSSTVKALSMCTDKEVTLQS